MGKSLYDILDIETNATPGDIKNAFLRLEVQYKSQADGSVINNPHYTAVKEAYDILSNPVRRGLYDQKLINSQQAEYEAETVQRSSPFKFIAAVLVLAVAGGFAYYHHTIRQAEETRQIAAMKLEQEKIALREAELKMEEEQSKAERTQQTMDKIDSLQRQAQQTQFQYETRQAIERDRRQQEYARREQERQEYERQRRERVASTYRGTPTVIRQ